MKTRVATLPTCLAGLLCVLFRGVLLCFVRGVAFFFRVVVARRGLSTICVSFLVKTKTMLVPEGGLAGLPLLVAILEDLGELGRVT